MGVSCPPARVVVENVGGIEDDDWEVDAVGVSGPPARVVVNLDGHLRGQR